VDLSNIDLIIIEGSDNQSNVELAQKTLLVSSKHINFASIKLIAPISPIILHPSVQYQNIKRLSWQEYNWFVTFGLKNFVSSDFCILTQTDGFITNPSAWNIDFLNYDYIGACWRWNDSNHFPQSEKNQTPYEESNFVGNGGFTLRSKKFLEETAKLPMYESGPEDGWHCKINYKRMKASGIKFAPPNIAEQFSTDPPNNKSFGFHGDKGKIHAYNL
jgi:hypothetical protein